MKGRKLTKDDPGTQRKQEINIEMWKRQWNEGKGERRWTGIQSKNRTINNVMNGSLEADVDFRKSFAKGGIKMHDVSSSANCDRFKPASMQLAIKDIYYFQKEVFFLCSNPQLIMRCIKYYCGEVNVCFKFLTGVHFAIKLKKPCTLSRVCKLKRVWFCQFWAWSFASDVACSCTIKEVAVQLQMCRFDTLLQNIIILSTELKQREHDHLLYN